MAELNAEKLKRLTRGEFAGNVALAVCGAVFVLFIIGFSVGRAYGLAELSLVSLIAAPVLMIAAAAVSAYCNIKFGGETDRLIKQYILDVFVENAALMHPERNSLIFNISIDSTRAVIKVNGYNEKIAFDFSAFGKLSAMRKLAVITAIENRLCVTFCRLSERGAIYSSVSYTENADKKKSKVVYIIENGAPDKKAMKIYRKNK